MVPLRKAMVPVFRSQVFRQRFLLFPFHFLKDGVSGEKLSDDTVCGKGPLTQGFPVRATSEDFPDVSATQCAVVHKTRCWVLLVRVTHVLPAMPRPL